MENRRIWIIEKTEKITEKNKADSRLNNCAEIVNGIPPRLKGSITLPLPKSYTEPLQPTPDIPIDIAGELIILQDAHIAFKNVSLTAITDLTNRVNKLEKPAPEVI